MKLIIQIPCFNEESTLPAVIRDLPKQIDGIDEIEIQVIDDGSTDRTSEVAESLGVHHIVRFPHNRGLAAAFQGGVYNALLQGADILVNTDGDNQYKGEDISKLVATMLEKHADVVIGCRPIAKHNEFSLFKKFLQRFGSWVVRMASNTDIPDATSGFRAYSRHALLRLNVVTDFSYCIETIIQSGQSNMLVAHTPVRVNPKTRESRLYRNLPHYVFKQLQTIIAIFILYRSNRFFGGLAAILSFFALLLAGRYVFLVKFMGAPPSPTWPTVIFAGVLLTIACLVYLVGTLASLQAAQRKLAEETLYHLRCLNLIERAEGAGPFLRSAIFKGARLHE